MTDNENQIEPEPQQGMHQHYEQWKDKRLYNNYYGISDNDNSGDNTSEQDDVDKAKNFIEAELKFNPEISSTVDLMDKVTKANKVANRKKCEYDGSCNTKTSLTYERDEIKYWLCSRHNPTCAERRKKLADEYRKSERGKAAQKRSKSIYHLKKVMTDYEPEELMLCLLNLSNERDGKEPQNDNNEQKHDA